MNLKQAISSIAKRGFFYIFGANVINKGVAFLSNILIVNFLMKVDYGVFTFANNVYSIMLLFTGFGALFGLLQFCSEDRDAAEKRTIALYCFGIGLAIDVALVVLVSAVVLFAGLPVDGAADCFMILAPLLCLDFCFQFVVNCLRAQFENKRFSRLLLINGITYGLLSCVGALLFGVEGLIAGRYTAYLISLVLGLFDLKAIGFLRGSRAALAKSTLRSVWTYSVSTSIASAMNQLTFLIDVFLVGCLIVNAATVAEYKVATMIPEGLLFIPACFVTFVQPYFAKNNMNMEWFSAASRKAIAAMFVISLCLAIPLLIVSRPLVLGLWGDQYSGAIVPFVILSISLLFSCARSMCTALLGTLREVKSNLIISIASLLLNVSLCFALIPSFGIVGAAFAPTIVSGVALVLAAVLLGRAIRCRKTQASE